MDEWESVALLTGRAELDRDTVAVAERGRGGWEHGSLVGRAELDKGCFWTGEVDGLNGNGWWH